MPYVVMTASTRAPNKARGPYRRVAVVETNLAPGELPSMIAPHARGVVRIIEVWEKMFVGKTRNSQYFKALDDAEELCRRLIVKDAIARKRERKKAGDTICVRVKPGSTVGGVKYFEATLLDVSRNWAAEMIAQGIAEEVRI